MDVDMTADVADSVAELDAMVGDDPEVEHSNADDVLLRWVPIKVAEAYRAAAERSGFWYA